MTTVRNLFFLFAFTLFGIASLILAIFNYNPLTSNLTAFADFYASLLASTTGISALAILYFKYKKHKNDNINRFFWSSARQALLIAIAVTTLFVLRGSRTLDWLIASSVIIVALLLELFFRTKRSTT